MGDDSPALQLSLPQAEAWEIAALTAEDGDEKPFSGCTGDTRAKLRRLRVQILELTLAGVGAKKCSAALGISPAAVRAVRSSAWERGELDPMKQRLGRQYLATADLLRAEALDRIDEIPAQVLLLASAQSADKGQLLTGGVTARVERREVPADLAALVDALPVDCTLVEPVESEAAAANKGPAAPGIEDLGAGALEAGAGSVADSVSAGLPRETTACESPCVSAERAAAGARSTP